jgi:hypothetical protein
MTMLIQAPTTEWLVPAGQIVGFQTTGISR